MTRNTLLYNVVFIVLSTIMAIFVAILLYELGNSVRTKVFQNILLFPHLISWVVASYLFYALLNSSNGFINKTLFAFFGVQTFDWYAAKGYWPFILTVVYLWKHTGYNAIVYLASISGINKELYEATEIDGATKLQQIRYITLPLIRPTVMVMVLMAVGRVFYSDFGLFYQIPMDSGQLYDVTQTIDTYVYRGLSNVSNLGMASAASFYQSFVGFAVVLASNLVVRRIDPDSALF